MNRSPSHAPRRLAVLATALGVMVGAIAAAPTGVAAQDSASGQTCAGTWLLHVTALGQPASTGFPVTAAFEADGTFISSSPVVGGARGTPSLTSTALGVWQGDDGGTCTVTHLFFVTDAQGALQNTIEIRLAFAVAPDGQTIAGTDYATVMGPDGAVVFTGPGNTVDGTRITLKLAPEDPAASPAVSPAP